MTMNNTGNKYSQYADVAPQTRKFHDHLMRKQHIREGLGFAVVLMVVFLAVMYLR